MDNVTDQTTGVSSQHPLQDTGSEPRNWNPNWLHLVLTRKTEDAPRRPVISMPDNCGAAPRTDKHNFATLFWTGVAYNWGQLTGIVDGTIHYPYATGSKDIGLHPEWNGLVILDCDVKEYCEGFVQRPGSKAHTMGETVVKYGINDLARLCQELGHDIQELATYTVRTKSGGFHLYFFNNPACMIASTKHHRADWRVDVIANNWVAAPPTPGYSVVRDYPVQMMPDWLAPALLGINERYGPVGGKKHTILAQKAQGLQKTVLNRSFTPMEPSGQGLLADWITAQLQLVRLADQYGAWNTTIYQVTKDFAAAGFDLETIEAAILGAAQPWDSHQERNAIATIQSGWRGFQTSHTFGR